MKLTERDLAFIVEYIAACRDVDDDAGLGNLLAALRLRLGSTSAWTGTCDGDTSHTIQISGNNAGAAPLSGCAPTQNAFLEPVGTGIRSCQSDNNGRSACLFMDIPDSKPTSDILRYVVPHLLDAVARVTSRPALTSLPPLTAREEQVLRWLGEGKSNWAIGKILGISERTVRFHLANIFQKLGVTTRTQAAAVAIGVAGIRAPDQPCG
jgi:DNA-binding CsgD family transcriptional regulator